MEVHDEGEWLRRWEWDRWLLHPRRRELAFPFWPRPGDYPAHHQPPALRLAETDRDQTVDPVGNARRGPLPSSPPLGLGLLSSCHGKNQGFLFLMKIKFPPWSKMPNSIQNIVFPSYYSSPINITLTVRNFVTCYRARKRRKSHSP